MSGTRALCENLSNLSLSDVPTEHVVRAKYLLLDGIACALIGAHLPHSEKAAKSIFSMESGNCSVVGYPNKLTPTSAALLNSTFIQGFELDDWHSEAPLHSNSLLIPSLVAAIEHGNMKVSGTEFLLALIAGYETGPRVGNALWGRHILQMGWHSGAVFGPAAVVASVGKLLGFDINTYEDAFGIACTQACGLMSAQFESEAKRMQHGFAARNGLFAALLAKDGYVGIKQVFEREYGGFLTMFSAGNGKNPQYKIEELTKGFGEKWQIKNVVLKPYSSMAATHGTVDCIRLLQDQHKLDSEIKSMEIILDDPMYHHGGFILERPCSQTGAQMNVAYVAATQLVDHEVLVKQFSPANLDRDEIWSLVGKIKCAPGGIEGSTEVRVTFENGVTVSQSVQKQKGVDPPLSNEEVVEKYRSLAKQVVDADRMSKIEEAVLNIDNSDDVRSLIELLTPLTGNALAND